jgi:hypothetical protein
MMYFSIITQLPSILYVHCYSFVHERQLSFYFYVVLFELGQTLFLAFFLSFCLRHFRMYRINVGLYSELSNIYEICAKNRHSVPRLDK